MRLRIRWSFVSFCLERRTPRSVFGVVSSILFCIVSLMSLASIWTYTKPDNSELEKYLPLEPDLFFDFPIDNVSPDSFPRIPHIIHQTARDTHIRTDFIPYVQSFIYNNPDWEYYFWTDASARRLIQDRHPYLLKLWDNYGKNINRADALRYVVLYEFGGVYADLDMENLRPLDRVTLKYACVIPPEPFEHSVFRLKIPFLLSNAFMMCRPKHPFFKHILENISRFQPMAEQIDTAGPAFLTSQFMSYNNFSAEDTFKENSNITRSDSSPYFYTGTLPAVHKDAVYISNTNFFMNTLDNHFPSVKQYYQKCNEFDNLNLLQRRACLMLYRRELASRSRFAFTQHHWYQSYFKDDLLHRVFKFNHYIGAIVQRCKVYGNSDVSESIHRSR